MYLADNKYIPRMNEGINNFWCIFCLFGEFGIYKKDVQTKEEFFWKKFC